ncbi:NAD-dependent epimerase/dehydratase family protein [Thiomonas bhubaneswarensis]|uniref:RmlD substrate binding domain n=1 Tax=Thiomonas bhubaneswarensis TaxID=339866 RepID=A0A0K6I015_9BURK|nr:NAD-dependent epimerase/dehydratase family protein [Thiomonas bhubaneswarensis]CUA96426.1 RmlD substrate binding domain [Thiomonas bhubaneswarensis]
MPTSKTVLILGANGRFGRVAWRAFAHAGWSVIAQSRGPLRDPGDARVRHVALDAKQPAAIVDAARGAAIVVNALNPIYTRWEQEALALNETAVTVARDLGATLMLPGNVYNYGREMPPVITDTTPERPSTRKGEIRCRMEARMRAGCARSIVVRAGDFFGGPGSGSWMDQVIAKDIRRGRITYPGPLDRDHAWAYLPDLARAFVLLAQGQERLPGHATVLFSGNTLTGAQLAAAITEAARAVGVIDSSAPTRVRALPWGAIGVARFVNPMLREIWRMRYLWQIPHRIDGAGMERIVGIVPSTPLAEAIRATLAIFPAPGEH